MGRDKALIEIDGRPLARVAADALDGAGASEVLAVGGDAEALTRLGLRVVPDGWPSEGPLGGVITALDAAGEDVVMVLACDLPDVTSDAVAQVVGALDRHDVAVAAVGDRPQYVFAAWRRRCQPVLRQAFSAGERAIWRAVVTLDVVPVTLRQPKWARDADVPRDLFQSDSRG